MASFKRRLTRFRVTALPTRLLVMKPYRLCGKSLDKALITSRLLFQERPRRNMASKSLRWRSLPCSCLRMATRQPGLTRANGEPPPALEHTAFENGLAALGTVSRPESVTPLTAPFLWLVGTLGQEEPPATRKLCLANAKPHSAVIIFRAFSYGQRNVITIGTAGEESASSR